MARTQPYAPAWHERAENAARYQTELTRLEKLADGPVSLRKLPENIVVLSLAAKHQGDIYQFQIVMGRDYPANPPYIKTTKNGLVLPDASLAPQKWHNQIYLDDLIKKAMGSQRTKTRLFWGIGGLAMLVVVLTVGFLVTLALVNKSTASSSQVANAQSRQNLLVSELGDLESRRREIIAALQQDPNNPKLKAELEQVEQQIKAKNDEQARNQAELASLQTALAQQAGNESTVRANNTQVAAEVAARQPFGTVQSANFPTATIANTPSLAATTARPTATAASVTTAVAVPTPTPTTAATARPSATSAPIETTQVATSRPTSTPLPTTEVVATPEPPTVSPAPVVSLIKVEISPNDLNLGKDTQTRLTLTAFYSDNTSRVVADEANWSTSDTAIATVNSYGYVRTVRGGRVNITVSYGGKSASVTMTVIRSLVSLTVSPGSATLVVGANASFRATMKYDDGSSEDITNACDWYMGGSDSGFATVSGGTVTGVRPGSGPVVASFIDKMGTASVTVVNPATAAPTATPVPPTPTNAPPVTTAAPTTAPPPGTTVLPSATPVTTPPPTTARPTTAPPTAVPTTPPPRTTPPPSPTALPPHGLGSNRLASSSGRAVKNGRGGLAI